MGEQLAWGVSVALVAAGVAAEIRLARLFLEEWRAGRRLTSTDHSKCVESQRAFASGGPPRRRASRATAGGGLVLLLAGTTAWAQQSEPTAADAVLQCAAEKPISADVPPPSLTISTDRPSFSDGTGLQPVGRLNVETGYTFTFRDRDGVETQRHNGPEVLARVGVIEDRLELRFLTSGYTWSRSDDGSGFQSVEGWSDVALGLKLKLLDQRGWVPRLALGAQTTLGGGSDNISTQMAEPTLKLIWSYDLGQSLGEGFTGVTLGGNANIAWPTSDGDRFTQGQGSIYVAFPIADGLSGFAEYFVIGPNSKGSDPAHYVDVGVTYLIEKWIQLDARVGYGLNSEADNVFAGVGVSFLF